jgi:hypothetical protein
MFNYSIAVGVNKVHIVQLLKQEKVILGGSNLDVNTEERRRRTSNHHV